MFGEITLAAASLHKSRSQAHEDRDLDVIKPLFHYRLVFERLRRAKEAKEKKSKERHPTASCNGDLASLL